MTASARLVFDTLTPVAAYAALRGASGGGASFLLESVVGGERWGRRTVVGYRPRTSATLTRAGWTVRGPDGAVLAERAGDPLHAAADLLLPSPLAARGGGVADGLAGAHFGYFAWELVHALYRVPAHEAPSGPLARFVSGCTLVVFDNLEQTVTVCGPSQGDVDRALADLGQGGARGGPAPIPDRGRVPGGVVLGMSDAEYVERVVRAKEYIAAGDAFQVVLARSFTVPGLHKDPFDVYRALRVTNPSPYMYFLDLPPEPGAAGGRTQILGASPETLVRLDDGQMTVRPIAGTRPRGKTPAEDLAFASELAADPKELAEHVMLIDLGRNDVGRVAAIGSVELARRMEIERYSHVMHLVSEVQGRVPATTPPLEVLRAAFPAGTLSGAPKLRAMQILRELERGPRGVYGGAVGYLAPTGDFDFAIAIRTAVCHAGQFVVTAGAGIVEASVPESEAEETWSKARGVLSAIASVDGGGVPSPVSGTIPGVEV